MASTRWDDRLAVMRHFTGGPQVIGRNRRGRVAVDETQRHRSGSDQRDV